MPEPLKARLPSVCNLSLRRADDWSNARAFAAIHCTGAPERKLRIRMALPFCQGLQRGMFHELPSLWVTWTQQVAEMSLQDSG